MKRAAAGIAIVSLSFGLTASCADYEINGPAGSGGAGATGSGSGTGGGIPCTSDSGCKALAGPCKTPRCGADGHCAAELASSEEDRKPHALGDCKKHVCQGGELIEVADAADLPSDANDCTKDECIGKDPVNTAMPSSECPKGHCKAEFGTVFCVECLEMGDCLNAGVGFLCQGNTCAPPICGDGAQDGNETGKDCGGPDCGPCPVGGTCENNLDCASGHCDGGKCVAESCADGVHHRSEASIDCGGVCDASCQDGKDCRKSNECESGICYKGACQSPQCDDNVQNGNEEDVDCGGSCPLPCP